MPKEKEGYFSKGDGVRQDSLNNARSPKPVYIIIIFVILLSLTFLATYLVLSGEGVEEVPTCGDGTFYNTCSLERPYYCDEGILTEKASICGCDRLNSGLEKKEDFCVSKYNTDSRDIVLKYILNGQVYEMEFTVYEGISSYSSNLSREISYRGSEVPFRSDFKLNSIDDKLQRANMIPLVKKIQNIAPDNKIDQARIAISIVQNIPYGFSDNIFYFEGQELDYSRYPYEVLFDNQGICGEKSELMAFLLRELGFGVSIFYFPDENHEAVGIKCPVDKSLYGTGFCFVETGSPAIITDYTMEFVGGVKLNSLPEVMLISEGLSLPDGLREYRDAKSLKDIRERNLMGLLKSWKYNGIVERYNLHDAYNLDDVASVLEEELEESSEGENSSEEI